MIGSGLVTLPWTFQNSGFLLGMIICIIGMFICYRTTVLMNRTAGNDEEYFHTLYKYWGKWAYYLGTITTLLIIIAAVCAFFILMSQMLYPVIYSLISWIFRKDLPVINDHPRFDNFSQDYCAIFIYLMLVFICMKRDLSIFINLMQYGSYFVILLMAFMVGMGIYSLTNTKYEILPPSNQ